MNTSAGAKLPPFARKPITIGTTIDAILPIKLNTPPVSPTISFEANVGTNTQVMEASPFPKKAKVINKIIRLGLFT